MGADATIVWAAASNFESGNKTQHRPHRWKKKEKKKNSSTKPELVFHDNPAWQKSQNKKLSDNFGANDCLFNSAARWWFCHAERRETHAARRRTLSYTSSSVWGSRGVGKKRLCNAFPALEGVFSSPNQITKVTPTAYPARGLHTVVWATKWDVGLGNFCNTKVFKLRLLDQAFFGKTRIQSCWCPGISFLGEICGVKTNHWIMLNFCTMRLFGSKWMFYTNYLLAFGYSSWTFRFESGLESRGEGLSLRLK